MIYFLSDFFNIISFNMNILRQKILNNLSINKFLNKNQAISDNLFLGSLSSITCYSIFKYANLNPNYNSSLNLDDFECKSTIIDRFSGMKVYRKYYEYFDKNTNTNRPICRIEFEIEPNAGHICILGVEKKYQRMTLGMQMINKVKEELKGKTDIIWGISGSDEIAAWYEDNKHNPNIKKIERGDNWPMYQINI